MEKRFLGFLIASMLTLFAFDAIIRSFTPPAPDPVADNQQGDAEPNALAEDGAGGAGGAGGDAGAEENDSNEPASEATADKNSDSVAESNNESEVEAPADVIPDERFTLGSLDPESPYRMLVTLNNRGASVERIELNDRRTTDIEDKSGYAGHLALSDEINGGCRVNIVGPGTPAAKAGIQVGDLIIAVNGVTVNEAIEYENVLQKTQPGSTATFVVRTADGNELNRNIALIKRPLQVVRPQKDRMSSYLLTLAQIGNRQVRLGDDEIPGLEGLLNENWKSQTTTFQDRPAIEFSFSLTKPMLDKLGIEGGLKIVKRYSLAEISDGENTKTDDAFHLDFQIEFQNDGDVPLDVAYRINGPTGLPLEGWWFAYKVHPTSFGSAGIRDIVVSAFDSGHSMITNASIVKQFKKHPESPETVLFDGEKNIRYAGVDSQYFLSALVADIPEGANPETVAADYGFKNSWARLVGPVETERQSKTEVSFRLDSTTIALKPGEKVSRSFKIFAGPKRPSTLKEYGLGECISYGWFRRVSVPLTWILHGFYAVFRNYGIAIILLTVLVRGCMFPLGRKQALNAQKMQELGPEMKKLAEKYKDDMEKRAAAQRELFSKHKVNPLAGCLPMFLQLPIFVGLYRALSCDIELRQASLIPGIEWCSNLAGPDMLWHWGKYLPEFLSGYAGFLGPYLNILPLISVGLMLVQQKMFAPPAQDEQQEMQMKMMKYMMVFFGFMFFKVPAGLCLYFITSSLWGIAERKLLPKPKSKTNDTTPVAPTKVSKPNKPVEPKKESFFSQLKNQVMEAAEKQKQQAHNGSGGKPEALTKEQRKQRQKQRKR